MANGNNNNDSMAQRRHERENDARRGNEDKVPGIDKKLNGPNRPAE
ncbi:hypothetical protein [Paenibacillus sp.]|nr:hypothetical protein [Paenibacillus sp.]HZG85028.1 hypothetical protein [Paenibacillus sp.]